MFILTTSFFVSLLITLVIVHGVAKNGGRLQDHDLSGPQKFHAAPVPRVGGIGIFSAVLASVLTLWWKDEALASVALGLMICALPAFGSGLAEDLTKNVSPARRLLFTGLSAGFAAWILDSSITRTGIPGLDLVMAVPAISVVLTIFAVTGVANAVNIIDGFNGLASMCVVLMLVSFGYVGFECGDMLIVWLATMGVGAILGFFVWNFPAGLIFLGDGGAYFLGFYVAEVAVLLLHRNPGVSPMFPLLVCIYPIFETLFSIYRKKYLRGMSPGVPDGVHFHMLIYRRLMRKAVGSDAAKALVRRNSMTSPYLWGLSMMAVVPAVFFWNSTPLLGGFIVLFAVSYVVLYWRIVRFKTPWWLKLNKG